MIGAPGAGIACLVGIAPWKRKRLRALLGIDSRVPTVSSTARALRIAARRGGAIAGWASRLPDGLVAAAETQGTPLWRIEDGFIRSAGLGAALVQPCSLVLDRTGIHYDSAQPSDLETILQRRAFGVEELARARALIDRLRLRGTTKYNLAGAVPELPPGKRLVLVLGQVDDDLSVALGGGGRTVADMLRTVLAEERDCVIAFKPHPDVVAGLRSGVHHAPGCIDAGDMDLNELLRQAERVHVLTSLGGFEALLRGCEVVVHGLPFYAGWSLTDDRLDCPRRTRRLTLEELVAGALIAYPHYYDPVLRRRCEVEDLLDRLEAAGPAKPPGRVARWWGRTVQRLGRGPRRNRVKGRT